MSQIEDELLMAYADGELDAERTAIVEARLAADPAAHDVVRRFRETTGLVRAAFAGAVDEPVPPALEAAVRTAARQGPASANVVSFPMARVRRAAAWMALAASLALVVGLSGGWWLGSRGPGASLAALETLASNQNVELAGGTLTPVDTFQDGAGRWCRQFSRTGDEAVDGIACRAADGSWKLQMMVAQELGAETGYGQAGDEGSPLDTARRELQAQPSINAEAEAETIRDGWRRPSR